MKYTCQKGWVIFNPYHYTTDSKISQYWIFIENGGREQVSTEFTDFGKKVRRELLERGMTQKKLAEDVGCTSQYIHKILVGERGGRKYIEKIRRVLNIEEAVNVEDRETV